MILTHLLNNQAFILVVRCTLYLMHATGFSCLRLVNPLTTGARQIIVQELFTVHILQQLKCAKHVSTVNECQKFQK
jgi:hypothetical protein